MMNWLRKGILICIIFGLIAAIGWTIFVLKNPEKFPLRVIKINVVNQNHLNPIVIKNVVSNNIHGSFFSFQAPQLRDALLALPWIHDVSFRRIWPDQLIINVQEQQAVARWDNNALLNAQGEIFQPPQNSFPLNLPLLSGPTTSEQEVWQCWQQLSQILSPLGVHITALSLSPRHSWELILNGQMQVVLGRESIDQRINHFIEIYPKVIKDRQSDVERVDLRYPNGVAIRWKSQVTGKINPATH